jgi:hypothetical protein
MVFGLAVAMSDFVPLQDIGAKTEWCPPSGVTDVTGTLQQRIHFLDRAQVQNADAPVP